MTYTVLHSVLAGDLTYEGDVLSGFVGHVAGLAAKSNLTGIWSLTGHWVVCMVADRGSLAVTGCCGVQQQHQQGQGERLHRGHQDRYCCCGWLASTAVVTAA